MQSGCRERTASCCEIFLYCGFNVEVMTEFDTKELVLIDSTLHALLGFVVLSKDSSDRIG